jgi:hypothetical protein
LKKIEKKHASGEGKEIKIHDQAARRDEGQ